MNGTHIKPSGVLSFIFFLVVFGLKLWMVKYYKDHNSKLELELLVTPKDKNKREFI